MRLITATQKVGNSHHRVAVINLINLINLINFYQPPK